MKIKTNKNDNPYLMGSSGRKEWDDRYMNMSRAIQHWRRAFFASLIMVLLFSGLITWLALSTKVQPFIVETSNGMPYAIKPLSSMSADDQRLINFAINQFIVNARTVISDVMAEKLLLNKVYAFSADSTLTFLQNYYRENNPFDLAERYTVSIKIVNTLPISKNTWQVVWEEEKRNVVTGNVIAISRWMANLTYKLGEINSQFMMENPFGFYITQISWAQSLV